MPRPSAYLTVGGVAELFGVSAKTVVRWANEDKLPHVVTLGGHRRFRRDEIDQVLGASGYAVEGHA